MCTTENLMFAVAVLIRRIQPLLDNQQINLHNHAKCHCTSNIIIVCKTWRTIILI
jgi:hypothetical protein